MMGRICAALCVLHVLWLGGAWCSLPNIRGLDPALAEHYKPKGDKFSCLDGQKTIMYSLINDDFCDCFDGSDEPGTSACVHGKFYCRNRGYTPQHLNASMVDDGFCDCCDGSDESSGKCGNTCAQAGAAARAELRAKAAREAAGAKVKEGYVHKAQEDKQRWQDEAAKLSQEIAQQQKLVDQWKVKKDGVEAAEAKDRARKEAEQKAKEEAQRKLDEERAAQLGKPDADVAAPDEPAGDHVTTTQPANAESGSADAAASDIISKAMGAKEEATDEPLDTSGNAAAEAADDLLPVMEQAKDAIEGSIEEALKASKAATDSILKDQMEQTEEASKAMNPHEAAKKEAEETSEERAKRIASQWIKDDSTAPTFAPAPTFDAPQGEAEDTPGVPAEDAAETATPLQSEEPEASEPEGFLAKARSLVTSVVSRLGFAPPIPDTVPSDSQKIKDTYWQHHNELAAMESREAELKKQLSQDYGPDGEYLTLRDRCFTADVDKYVYEICPYGDSAQKDGQSRTSLGSWKGFEENYSFMSFSGGQVCWNGPQRSMRVALQCGEKEHLQHVVEPSKCEYVAEFTTPAACHAENAEKLQQQVLEDEQALQGAHDEL